MKPIQTKNLSERDREFIWHPLTQHRLQPDAVGIIRASGALLFDESGRSYIDGIASWYTSIFGHCNPYITSRVAHCMNTLDQVVFSGFTHEPAVLLSEALMTVLPANQKKLFFSDNGSTAVEVALKMALQYHVNRGDKRQILLALEDGFHGDTFGAMSVSGLSVYNGPFESYFLKVERIPVPRPGNREAVLQRLQKRLQSGDIAAFIYEPLVQGAAGMKMHDSQDLDMLLKMLQDHDIITIADEVMTGFGKTGKNFASDHMETKPDIMCLSKALTAGLLPMAVTSCTQRIYDAFYSEEISKGLFHGHTYTANPLACTAALAALDLLKSPAMQMNIERIIRAHREFDREVRDHPVIAGTRQCGVIYALDLTRGMERYGQMRDQLYRHFMDQGIYLRPLGNTLYILPPYIIEDRQLHRIYAAIKSALELF